MQGLPNTFKFVDLFKSLLATHGNAIIAAYAASGATEAHFQSPAFQEWAAKCVFGLLSDFPISFLINSPPHAGASTLSSSQVTRRLSSSRAHSRLSTARRVRTRLLS
jgi:hypothetical protein